MKTCRFRQGDETRTGILRGDYVIPLIGNPSVVDALSTRTEEDSPVSRDEVTLVCPLPKVRNLFCAAGNYYAHVAEGGKPRPDRERHSPRFFLKPNGVLIGPDERLRIPSVSPNSIDWECELAVVIGRRARLIRAEEADDHIAGYTIFNDFSDRAFRLNPDRVEDPWDPFFDWLHGKWHDTFGALGPVIATRDELPSSLLNTRIRLTVNSELRQDSTLADMILTPAELIAKLSRIVTLQPGDVLATGTPAGVAAGGTGLWLKPNDRVTATIDGLGDLRTLVEAE